MRYAEFDPPAGLAAHVRCAWTFESEASIAPERIVPDGRPELIVHFGAPYAELAADGRLQVQPQALFAGQVTRPLVLQCAGPAGVVGIRFHPEGARAFLGRAMREATDLRLDVDTLWPGEGASLAHGVQQARDDAARIEVATAFVARRIAASNQPPDALVRACVRRIESANGAVAVEALLADCEIGRRQLERRFGDAVGIGPALLAAVFRLRAVFDVLQRDGSRPWTEAALAAGYYDQSHFIRDFRRFVGCSPSEFFRSGSELAGALVDA